MAGRRIWSGYKSFTILRCNMAMSSTAYRCLIECPQVMLQYRSLETSCI